VFSEDEKPKEPTRKMPKRRKLETKKTIESELLETMRELVRQMDRSLELAFKSNCELIVMRTLMQGIPAPIVQAVLPPMVVRTSEGEDDKMEEGGEENETSGSESGESESDEGQE
jgi:hypothetical protein